MKYCYLILAVAAALALAAGCYGFVTDAVSGVCIAQGADAGGDGAIAELAFPDDPYLDDQWAVGMLDLPQAWHLTEGSEDVIVAVLDTGIDADHEDLAGRVVQRVNLSDSRTMGDVYGHGTHVAGVIAAASDNGMGISGVAPGCSVLDVKVADDDGRCLPDQVADGIRWAVDRGARVLNISLCFSEPSDTLAEAVDYAWERGAVVVAAAGNGGGATPHYPAYYEHCIAVTAIEEDGTRAPLAAYGDWVDVAAPGYQIVSTVPGDEYGYKTGTSQATAYVSGLAALLSGVAVDADGDGRVNDEVRAAIEESCRQLTSRSLGSGLVDCDDALRLVPGAQW